MSDRLLLATFDHEEDVLAATAEVRGRGYRVVDVFTPYPVHGLDQAMGLRSSRLTWVCFICAMIGAVGMLWFQHWVGAIDWPIDVGGKPWNSLPAHVPVAFEMAVLLGGFGSVFALLAVCRLFPGKRARLPNDRITNDRFVLVLDEFDASFDVTQVKHMLNSFHVVQLEERVASTGGPT